VRFCSACGGDVEVTRPEGDERERFVCATCSTVHYVNPKIVVGSVCTFEDRVLICRRAIEPRIGYWTIPAGWMEVGETAEEGAIREAREEACANIAIEGLIAVYSIPRIDQVQILFRAKLLDSAVAAGPESQEVKLVSWDEIPWDELAFPTVTWVLRRAIELRGLHYWPATFNPEMP
jgi:ADP-ribose pyrophosphatase YjhB (NUDIX family)